MAGKTTEGVSWRDKYLRVLDDQEKQQRLVSEQLDLLRKALTRVSLAAEGLDYQLDSALENLREGLRIPKTATLQKSVASLEEAVRTFEARRSQRSETLEAAFSALVSQLQELSIPRDVSSGLKKYQRTLRTRLAHLQQYPNLLEELAQLQQQTLDAMGVSKPGLWERFTGQRKASSAAVTNGAQEDSSQSPTSTSVDADTRTEKDSSPNNVADTRQVEDREAPLASEVEEVEEREADGDQGLIIEGQFDQLQEEQEQGDLQATPEAQFQRPLHEPAFSKISDKITGVLTDFLEHVEPVPCVVQKAQNARERIDRGLNWYELVPTLEEIRDLVMQAYLAADTAFVAYLDQVNSELEEIYALLSGAVQSEAAVRDAGQQLQQQVSEQVSTLEQAVAASTDLEQLKTQVHSQIGSIRNALQGYQQDPAIDEQPLAEQLQALVTRVQSMEEEAQQNKDCFEEQRRKALMDSLTELPNREAYAERSHHEMQRWQRYGHPLSLAVCDIDFFKRINDNYGHQAGDRVLKVISSALSKRLREVDFMARYGGEEFVILMPETPGDNAMRTLDKIREALAQTPFHFKEKPVQITLSIGVAEFEEGDDVERVFARADKALYTAKDNGRNCCQFGRKE